MGKRKTKRMTVNNGKLWPSTFHIGDTTVQFQTGRHGKRVTVTSKRHQPRHKRLNKRLTQAGDSG